MAARCLEDRRRDDVGMVLLRSRPQLLYYGTSNPGPWNSNQRPGDNLWATTLFARDPGQWRAQWAYQFNPHDLWDHDEIQENVLVDLISTARRERRCCIPAATATCMSSTGRTEKCCQRILMTR